MNTLAEIVGTIFGWGLVMAPVIGGVLGIVFLGLSFIYAGQAAVLWFAPTARVVVTPKIVEKKPKVSKKKSPPPTVATFSEEFKLPEMPFS